MDSQTAIIIGAILMMFNGIVLYRIFDNAKYIYNYYRTRNQFPRLVSANWELDMVCKPHHWVKSKLALSGIEPGQYLVCDQCGIVSGHNHLRLNQAGLEVLKNNDKLQRERQAAEEASITRMKEILEADRNMWIKTFSKEFGKDQNSNEELLQRFSKFTVESVNAATQRVIEEFKGKI